MIIIIVVLITNCDDYLNLIQIIYNMHIIFISKNDSSETMTIIVRILSDNAINTEIYVYRVNLTKNNIDKTYDFVYVKVGDI